MVTRHQKLSANRSRWLNLDLRAMDTNTEEKKKERSFLGTSDGEAESVVDANPHGCGSGCTQTLSLRVLE